MIPKHEQYRPDLAFSISQMDLAEDREGFVGKLIAPVFEVSQQAGVYGVIPVNSQLKQQETARASTGAYNRSESSGKTDSYSTREHGLEQAIDSRESKIVASYFDAEMLAAERAQDAVARNHEIRIVNKSLGISTTKTLATPWTSVATANPLKDITEAKKQVRLKCGRSPNTLILEEEVFNQLKMCDWILANVKYTQDPNANAIGTAQIAAALGLKNVHIAKSMINTAKDGDSAPTFSTLWPETKALLFIQNEGLDLKRPQFMRTMHWGEDGSRFGGVFESYYDMATRSHIIRNRMDTDEKILYEETALVLENIAA